METSNALDLERGIFRKDSPRAIARSLKWSAEQSRRRKSDAFRSAMSMLNIYLNRAGKNLPQKGRETIEKAKDELRALCHRPSQGLAAPSRMSQKKRRPPAAR